MTQTLWRINNASLDLNVLRHAVIASQDGWAYFPKVNPDVDWGAALAAVSDNPDDLDKKIFMTDEAKQQRINANGGKPLEFQTVPALSLRTLLREIGNVDMIPLRYSGIRGGCVSA